MKMNQINRKVFLALLAMGTSATLSAAPAQHIDFENTFDFRAAGTVYQKPEYISMVSGGHRGKCFRLFCPADVKSIRFHNWTRPQIKVASSSAPVKFSIYMKGKGSIDYGFIVYDGKRRPIYPAGTSRKAALNSDKWQKYEFTYTPVAGKLYANSAGYIMPYLSVAGGSEIFIDDITVEFADPVSSIKIEE